MTATVAYIVSRFPKLTETFILYEMEALAEAGWQVELFPLLRGESATHHSEAGKWIDRAHYLSYASAEVAAAHLHWWRRRPRTFLRLWRSILWGHRSSPKFLSRALAVLWLAPQMAIQMQAAGVQHIHAHWATHPTLAALVVHELTGIPYSFTGHAHDLYVDRTMLAEKMAAARFVVTISEHNRMLLTQLYGPELGAKVNVVHCGVDTDLFQQKSHQQEDDELTLICIGSLEPKKGQRYLVAACHLLAERGLPFRCWLVGDGDLRPALEKQIGSLGLSERVKLWGRQRRSEVLSLLSRADIMVLPSVRLTTGKQEGIPVALMEGLAAGLPAVASNLSGIPELIEDGETGLLIPERDAGALADAIEKLYHDPSLRRSLAEAGRKKVEREFNLARNVTALAQLFARAAALPPSPGKKELTRQAVEWQGGPT